MSIKSLYKDYFQKSRVFLYPALQIKRGVSVTPIDTYISWRGRFKPEDRKFICLYHLRDDEEFVKFEKVKLLNNKLFHDFVQVKDKGAYIFDFDSLADDWDYFVSGKYSQMSRAHKRQIKNFYGPYSSNFAYVDSFLEPEKYFKIYSDLLDIKLRVLKEIGELCDKPDLDRETLIYDLKPITIKQSIL